MKLLLDECLDWRLLRELPDHEVKTTRQMGWSGITNGALLRDAEKEFEVFVSADQNLRFQQNLTDFDIAVIVLRPRSLRLSDIRRLIPNLRVALTQITRGEIRYVDE